jgi:hypothetical protein
MKIDDVSVRDSSAYDRHAQHLYAETSLVSLRSLFWNKKFWEELIAYFPWNDTGHIENDASNNFSTIACVFVTAVTFLPNRRLATKGGFLPSRYLATIESTHTQAATWSHKPTFIFFKIRKVGLWDHVAVCVCVPPIVAR